MSRDDTSDKPRRHGSLLGGLRNSFLTGIIVIAPIGLTVWLIWTVIGWVDGVVMPLVPGAYHPENLVNRLLGLEGEERITVNIRGVGVIFFLVFTVLVGWVAKGLIGRSFIRWGESIVGRLPIIRSVYNALKQIAETVFSQRDNKFDKVCLIQFPRDHTWAIAFISSEARGEVRTKVTDCEGALDDDIVSVFMPSTPNPTTGFLMFLPRSQIVELDMTLEQAAKLIISAGLVYPEDQLPPAEGAIPLAVRRMGR